MSMISELIEELIDNADLYTKELHDLMYRAADTIEMLSKKAREQEWIPCSERLPEEGVGVLAQYGDGSIFAIGSARPNLWKDITVIDCQIVAWMPLPEPRKKDARCPEYCEDSDKAECEYTGNEQFCPERQTKDTGEWILCKDRLPSENGKTYLTCHGDPDYEWYQTLTYYDGWNCTKGYKESELDSVVAWMEIPKLHPTKAKR